MMFKKITNATASLIGIASCTFVFMIFALQSNAQTILPTNTGTACHNCAPPGWSVLFGSTDISNTVGWAGTTTYPWVSATNPPNGHTTWVNGFYTEMVGTTATGLIPGVTYNFSFYSAEMQSTSGGTVDVNFDGVLGIYDCNTNAVLGTFPYSGGPNSAWKLETLTFTATASTKSLCFKYATTSPVNGNFWNVAFGTNVVNPTCDLTMALAVVNVACNGDASGAATASGANGAPPYTYQWSNGSNSPSINTLFAGTYTVTVTDADGCAETRNAVVTEPPLLQMTITNTAVPCAGGTATATINPAGGTPGYTYNWSANANGQTTATATGLTAGTYFVTLTDSNQCRRFSLVTIPPGSPISLNVSSTDVTCHGEKDGTATANVVGGSLPFKYLWSNGQILMTANTLDAGTYTVTITDASGCEAVETVIISEPPRVSIVFDVANVGCDSIDDGMTTALNVGGVPPISYKWGANTGNQTTPTASNLGTGVYNVTLTDTNGCDAIAGVTVNAEDCAPPCVANPCAEAVYNNTDICAVLTNNPNDPLSTLDCDQDGVTNATECTDGTDPLDPCDFVDTSITLPVTADQSGCPFPCPDLAPVSTILPGNIAGYSPLEVAVQITELENVDTDGTIITVRMPSDPRLVFVWNIGLTMAALTPVQNANWNYQGDNGIVHTWVYNGPGLIIGAGGKSAFGFQSFYDPQATDGQTTLTATILPFSGGECNILNNTDSERLVYFE